jgi:drug/metabolite transporter (DMT)-like permease
LILALTGYSMTPPSHELAAEAEDIPAILAPAPERASLTTTYLTLAGGVLCIGFSAIFVRLAHTTGDIVSVYRLGIAALAMSIPVLINWRRGRARLPLKALPFALLAGLLFSGDTAIWSTAVNLTTAANATLLGNTAPLWVGLGAMLIFREKLGRSYWLGVAIAMIGVLAIIGFDALQGLGTNPGNLLALVSGMCYSGYQLTTQRGRSQIDTLTYSFIFSATGTVVLLIVTMILRHPLTGYPANSYLAMLGLALVSHLGGWLLINYAFGRLRASIVSVTLLAQPVITALIALPLLGETPTIWHIVGGAITLAGIYLVHRSMSQNEPEKQ